MSSSGDVLAVYATDETSAEIEALQLTLGEGPCIDAAANSSPVLVGDLSDRTGGLNGRWPVFLAEVARLGVRAVFAFPVRMGAIRLGTMDLFRWKAGPLDDEQLAHALLAVDRVALALLDESGHIEDGLTSQMVVHQATGIVMVQLDSSVEDALLRLRATAYVEGVSINILAAAVVSGRRHFPREEKP
jgi:hypothetical protein